MLATMINRDILILELSNSFSRFRETECNNLNVGRIGRLKQLAVVI